MEEQKLQNEWNNQSSQQEIKKLNQENQQKNVEIQVTRQEATKAKQDVVKAKQELEMKQHELAQTQALIDSAKAQLIATKNQLTESELVNKRIREELQHQEDSVKILRQEQALRDLKLKSQEAEIDAQKQKNRFYITAAVLGLGLFVLVALLLAYRQKTIRELASKNKIIEEEK